MNAEKTREKLQNTNRKLRTHTHTHTHMHTPRAHQVTVTWNQQCLTGVPGTGRAARGDTGRVLTPPCSPAAPGGLPCPPGHSDEPPVPAVGGGRGWTGSPNSTLSSRGHRWAGRQSPALSPRACPGSTGQTGQSCGPHGLVWEGTRRPGGGGEERPHPRLLLTFLRDHLVGGWPWGHHLTDTEGQWWPELMASLSPRR